MALIQAHLLEGPRRLPASLLVERLGRDLERFRAEGWDLPQPASAYLADWLAAGWLERGLSADGEEEYEASAAAAQAIRFAQDLSSQRTVATESRLGLVIGQLAQLAEETEPDPAIRGSISFSAQTMAEQPAPTNTDGRHPAGAVDNTNPP